MQESQGDIRKNLLTTRRKGSKLYRENIFYERKWHVWNLTVMIRVYRYVSAEKNREPLLFYVFNRLFKRFSISPPF